MAENRLSIQLLLRNDNKTNWEAKNPILGAGELGIERGTTAADNKFKIGDGTTPWNDLGYTYDTTYLYNTIFNAAKDYADTAIAGIDIPKGGKVYIVDSLESITAVKNNGDIAIVSETINGDKKQLTTYIYRDEVQNWVAMDGNYNAENVYFKDDFLVTNSVGAFTVSGASATLSAAGKNVKQIFEALLTKEDSTNLKKTSPSLSVNGSTQYKEIGTKVTPSFSTTFSAGEYKYGPATGITVVDGSYEVTNNKTDEKITASSGTFAQYAMDTVTSYTVTAKCDTTAGATPVSNTGNAYSAQAYAAIDDLSSSAKTLYTSFIPNFIGYIKDGGTKRKVDPTNHDIDSSFIRSLTMQSQTSGAASASSPAVSSTYQIKEKWLQFFYAIPASRKSSMTAKDSNNITLGITKIANVKVIHRAADENGEGEVSTLYNVFVIDNTLAYDATTITMA